MQSDEIKPVEFHLFAELLGRSNATILDVGANDGTHTNAFLSLFPHARVFAFEPEPRAIAKWRARVLDPRAVLFEVGVAAEAGRRTFHQSTGTPPEVFHPQDYPAGWDQSGSIRRPARHIEMVDWVHFGDTIEIDVVTLDGWAEREKVRGVDLIWADVQGAEGDLIAGGRRVLDRTRYLYTEFSDHEMYEGEWGLAQIVAALPDFEVIKVFESDVLLRNRCFAL